MSDLVDLIEPLKRYVAPPGTFAVVFPNTTDTDLLGSLLDAFAETQLDGFFIGAHAYIADDDGSMTPTLARGEGALITLYAATNIVLTQLANLKNRVRYEAKGLVYETEQSASILAALLKTFGTRKNEIIALKRATSGAGAAFAMADQYFARALFGGGGYGVDRAYDYVQNQNLNPLTLGP